MTTEELESILIDACNRFINDFKKFKYIFYEADLRSAIYLEIIRVMDKKGFDAYPIYVEFPYQKNSIADLVLGENKEVAIELKLSIIPTPRPNVNTFQGAKIQIQNYLKNGAKAGYLIYLDYKPPPDSEASKYYDLGNFGFSGKWRRIDDSDFIVAKLVS